MTRQRGDQSSSSPSAPPPPGPVSGVKNLRVTDPTMTSLAVNWDPADGAVRLYKVFYVPVSGGLEEMVRRPTAV